MLNKTFIRSLSFFYGLVVFVFLPGCAHVQAPQPGAKPPVITNSYAIEKGRYGDILKMYIEADDPDNDMLRIAALVEQVGYGRYSPDWIYLKPQSSGRLVGYLQWNTSSSRAGGVPEWTRLTIKVSVFDKAGNESNVVVFPFEFVSEVIKNPPPPAPFDQANLPRLGYVDVNLFNPTRDGREPRIPRD